MDSFIVKISKQAAHVDYEALSQEEKEGLFKGIEYSPKKHTLYRFNVAPIITTGKTSKKQQKRQAYSKADRVLIQIRDFKGIALVGIYPVDDQAADSSKESEYGAEGSVSLFNVVNLKLSGKAKDEIAKKRINVNSAFTEDVAQWIFLKPYIEANQDFLLFIACADTDHQSSDKVSMLCDVSIQDHGRNLCRPISKRILLPK